MSFKCVNILTGLLGFSFQFLLVLLTKESPCQEAYIASYTFFESTVEVPRIKIGKKQTIETLINEEALLFGKFLRDEIKSWIPRILTIS
jgi:hypothetical protein